MTSLLSIAEANGIEFEYTDLPLNGSLSTRLDDGACAFALDTKLECHQTEARVHAAHELGHCMTGSFYNVYAPLDVRGKHERQADAWAIHELMPWEEVTDALCHGCCTVYDFAEWFGVTQWFAEKAMELYCGREYV